MQAFTKCYATSALCLSLLMWPTLAMANTSVKTATKHYLRGNHEFKSGHYKKAIRAFRKAYRLLPRHPHFHCHRAQFSNYIAAAQERLKRPYRALSTYYSAAHRQGCRNPAIRDHALRAYRRLDRRWVSAITFQASPQRAKVRIYQITKKGDQNIGTTPLTKRLLPGRYSFKLRLFDHRTIFWTIRLRPGQRITRRFQMERGDDPITAPENPVVTPPIVFNQAKAPKDKPKESTEPKLKLPTPREAQGKTKDQTPLPGTTLPGHVKPGPPVYKQAWFWVVIGGVAAAAIAIPIAIPKAQEIRFGQSPIFRP